MPSTFSVRALAGVSVGLLLASTLAGLAGPLTPAAKATGTTAMSARAAVTAIEEVLDDFHRAAADAHEERYFAHLAPGAVFLGTDATERWSREEFLQFAHPYFERGQGWTYVPRQRHVAVAESGDVAWFDEILDNENYGTCRGTGVLQLRGGRWRIEQYHLTIPLPNELARDVVEQIRAHERGEGRGKDE